MKSIFSFVVLVGVIAVLGYFLLGYQVVHTDGGYNVIKKKDFEFSAPIIDTRDWDLRDWAENSDITEALARDKWDDIRKQALEQWDGISGKFEEWTKEFDIAGATEDSGEKLEDIRQEAKRRYDDLVDEFRDSKISKRDFERNLEKLSDWTTEQYRKLRRELTE